MAIGFQPVGLLATQIDALRDAKTAKLVPLYKLGNSIYEAKRFSPAKIRYVLYTSRCTEGSHGLHGNPWVQHTIFKIFSEDWCCF